MKATGNFLTSLSQDGFEKDFLETKFQTITSQSQFEKVTAEKSIAELWAAISNQMINHQLPHTRLDQISYYKHDILL